MVSAKHSLISIAFVTLLLAIGAGYMRRNYASKVLASGQFHQVAHKGEGAATILQLRNGNCVLRLTSFRTADKPNLTVLLISAPDAYENQTVLNSRVFNLGSLQKAEGDQEYALPSDIDLSQYYAVTIWNHKYGVNFTTAPLQH